MRRHGFDWLRIFVIFLLFPFHTARVFDIWEPNYVKDTVNGFSTWFVAALGYWVMPLLFVIAGYGAYCALTKRSTGQFLKERALRLIVPLIFGLIVIVPPQGYLALTQQYGFTGGYFSFLGRYFTDFSDLSGYTGSFTPAHLWFILYLFIISAALVVPVRKLAMRPERLQSLARPWLVILAFIPLTAMQALPDIGGKNIFYFALFFVFGAVFANSGAFLEKLKKLRFPLLSGGLLTGAVMFLIASRFGWPDGYTLEGISFALLRNLSAWLLILGLLGVADTYLSRPIRALSYLNRASYPVYLVHQTLLLVVAYYVVMTDLPPALKFIVIAAGSLVVSVGCFEICRRFRVTRFLFGIK